jgi:predicted dehydrogenase
LSNWPQSSLDHVEEGALMANSPLRIGVLGAARITPPALIAPARKVDHVQVTAIAARDPVRARAFAAKHGIPQVHDTYAALIEDPTLDAVYNPLPNNLHAEWTIRALQAGKHVLCEKPLASNTEEAMQMAQVAQETGRILVEAFHYRYHPLAARMKAIVDGGELGPVRHLETNFCVPFFRRNDIRLRYELAGGALMDLGCYTVNLLRYLAGAEPQVVRAEARRFAPQVDQRMSAELRFPDGRTALLRCAFFSFWPRVNVRVVGEAGELHVINPFLPHLWHRLTVRTAQGRRSERLSGETTYTHQLRAFVALLQGGPALPTDAADGIANMRVIDAIYQTAGLALRGLPVRQS